MALPIRPGDKLTGVRVLCESDSGASGDLTATLYKLTSTPGNASGSQTSLASASSAANANVQALTLSFSASTAGSDDSYLVVVTASAATGGYKRVFSVEYTTNPQ